MAFWGVEVKPGKAYTHLYEQSRGRLRVSQATLGVGKAIGKSVLQCNVGEKSPILLCTLIPDKAETCHLELEFEEYDDEVVFSVLGQRSVHLSGYYLGASGRHWGGGDDSDSYGEDIAETESDHSGSYDSEDDEYDSDFIDDRDIEMYPSSPPHKSNVVIEEIVEDDEPAYGNGNRRRLKKNQVSDSDDGDSQCQLVKHNSSVILESEDEDGFPIFSLRTKKTVRDTDATTSSEDKKRKIDAISPEAKPTSSEVGAVHKEKSKSKKKKEKTTDAKPLETISKLHVEERIGGDVNKNKEDGVCGNHGIQTADSNIENKGIDLAVKDEIVGIDNDTKLKKTKKERVKKGKAPGNEVGYPGERTEEGAAGGPSEALNNEKTKVDDSMDQDLPVEADKLHTDNKVIDSSILTDAAFESSGKQKKKNKKKRTEDDTTEEKDGQDGRPQAGEEKLNNGEKKLLKSGENEGVDDDATHTQQSNDKVSIVNGGLAPAADQQEPKKKKKKKNKNIENDSNINKELLTDLSEQMDKAQSTKPRMFPNGFIVEELSMGKPDGKRASRGRKVSVHYIGRLQNGEIFDSTTGKKPFTFRLGIGAVIKGWDIGVEGMRVGDKRRLTIPPSLGYGEKRQGKIPGNSWLVFDVELVNVK